MLTHSYNEHVVVVDVMVVAKPTGSYNECESVVVDEVTSCIL